MPIIKYPISLTNEQKRVLSSVSQNPNMSVRQRNRARILLRANDGFTDRVISQSLSVTIRTVGNIRKRFVEEGIESAINERPRPGQKKFDKRKEEKILKLIENNPPNEKKRWTLRLLASHISELDWVDSISYETIRTVLKKYDQTLDGEYSSITSAIIDDF